MMVAFSSVTTLWFLFSSIPTPANALLSGRSFNKQSSNQVHSEVPNRRFSPPFPNGPCGGKLVTLPKEDTYGISELLSGNTFLLPPRDIPVWLPPTIGPNTPSCTRMTARIAWTIGTAGRARRGA